MDQPGKAANPLRDQLKRKKTFSSVPIRGREFGLARRVRLSHNASGCSFSTLRLNLVVIHGDSPHFPRRRLLIS